MDLMTWQHTAIAAGAAVLITSAATIRWRRPLTAAWRDRKRLMKAAKHLIVRRKELPLLVRVPATIAAPFMLMPGIPDAGIDELMIAIIVIILVMARHTRERSLAVWQSCLTVAERELKDGEYCEPCQVRWQKKQARTSRLRVTRSR